jgi:hypothetical protein
MFNHSLLYLYSLGSGFVCALSVLEDKWRGVAENSFAEIEPSQPSPFISLRLIYIYIYIYIYIM